MRCVAGGERGEKKNEEAMGEGAHVLLAAAMYYSQPRSTTAVKRGHLQRPTSLAAHKAVIGERSTIIIMLNRHCKPRPWLWRSPGGRGAQVEETLEAWPTHMSAIALHVLTAPVHVMLGNVWLGNSNSRARPSTASRQTPMGA